MSANEADLARKRKRRWIIALILLLLVTLIGVFVFAPQGKDNQPVDSIDPPKMEDRGFGEDGELDMTNAETIRAGVQQKADESMVRFKINTNPVYSNGEVNWMIENPAQNKYLAQVDIMKDGEVIYKSPTLKPNQKVQSDKVDLSFLSPGTHEVLAVFYIYDEETKYLIGKQFVDKVNLTISGGSGV
ncbi:hypothetical protein NYE69_26345 [Paenibacillus sp. FSL R5-0527]|uniref:hypothetical protein n=1 Tax=Paenibacillus sp. FSL R5-0527 TaxID=2975321 RepID=UPI00097AF447|nr:hypothetical protein BK140_10470 [Paenibacillus macerans]